MSFQNRLWKIARFACLNQSKLEKYATDQAFQLLWNHVESHKHVYVDIYLCYIERMNIFYLSHNPQEAAELHVDRHVVKMILESAQLLCTAHRVLDGVITQQQKINKSGKLRNVKRYVLTDPHKESLLYNATHIDHPCAVWARDSINNYMWLYELFVALCDEYTHRYGKTHKTDTLLRSALCDAPISISSTELTPPAQAMPDTFKHSDPVVAYRQYYIGAKSSFAKWTRRPIPEWFQTMGDTHANV
jgi:hypothetical protein